MIISYLMEHVLYHHISLQAFCNKSHYYNIKTGKFSAVLRLSVYLQPQCINDLAPLVVVTNSIDSICCMYEMAPLKYSTFQDIKTFTLLVLQNQNSITFNCLNPLILDILHYLTLLDKMGQSPLCQTKWDQTKWHDSDQTVIIHTSHLLRIVL